MLFPRGSAPHDGMRLMLTSLRFTRHGTNTGARDDARVLLRTRLPAWVRGAARSAESGPSHDGGGSSVVPPLAA